MIILCCGDREWRNEARVEAILSALPPGTVIVHGDQRGADRIAGKVGHALGFVVHACPAEWDRYGKAAGPIRNRAMLALHQDVELVIAFHDSIETSKGTRDMLGVATDRGIVCRLVTSHSETLIVPPKQLPFGW